MAITVVNIFETIFHWFLSDTWINPGDIEEKFLKLHFVVFDIFQDIFSIHPLPYIRIYCFTIRIVTTQEWFEISPTPFKILHVMSVRLHTRFWWRTSPRIQTFRIESPRRRPYWRKIYRRIYKIG